MQATPSENVSGSRDLGNIVTPEEWDRLLLRQEELEDNCMARGGERFKKRLRKAAEKDQLSTYGAAKRLLTGGLEPLEGAIKDLCEPAGGRARGGQHVAVKWLKLLGEEAARVDIARRNKSRAAKELEPLAADVCERIRAEKVTEGYATAAYMALKVILDGIEKKRTLHLVATSIADLIRDELRYRRFRELAPKLYEYKLNSFNTSSYAYMARSLDGSMRGLRCPECLAASRDMTLSEKRAAACPHMAAAFDDLAISPNHRYLLGAKLVDLLITATGLVMVHTETTKRSGNRKNAARKQLYVEAEPDTLEWLSKRNGMLELLKPVTLPMVVPPVQWAPGERGGYRFALRNRHSLVRGASKAHSETINGTHMPLVYQAVNAIQNTAWRVNTDVLKVLLDIKEQGGGLAGVPLQDLIEPPAKPFNIGGEDREAEIARVTWKRAAHKVREQNKLRARDAIEFSRRMDVIAAVKDERAIFFPHTLDFRGRVYPVSPTFSPQGEDMSKGLLTFATGKPIGPEGGKWLAIHGANCLGEWNDQKVSKMTLDERQGLILSLSHDIWYAASKPLEFTWWTKAEEPVQFLAFCIEYAAWLNEGVSESFISTLPVASDGTCNGLQHFSALLRDEIGGDAVNLVPRDRPNDIYERIAEHVTDQLEEQAGTNGMAVQWLASKLVKRKLTKRPTMTFGYGSKKFGFQAQLCEYVQGLGGSSEESKVLYEQVKAQFMTETDEPEARIVQACGYMSECIWTALQETVVAASLGMAWLQSCARAIVRAGKGVTWTVPGTGFPVKQEYWVMNVQQIETMIAGKVVRPAVYHETDGIETHKQVNAVAPNVVHSLDAAALMLTVSYAMNDGVESFAAIHDSYGCLAGDMEVLSRATRQGFVTLYTLHDVIGGLAAEFKAQAGEAGVPEAPPKGKLDIAGVLASPYFFS
jgi:DNA-directed RNA polymerase